MAPREGNSIVKHGVLDERLNVHGVKGLKVADLSICPVSQLPLSLAVLLQNPATLPPSTANSLRACKCRDSKE